MSKINAFESLRQRQKTSEVGFFDDVFKASLPLLQSQIGEIKGLDLTDRAEKDEGLIQVVDPEINGGRITNIPSVFDGRKTTPKIAIFVAKKLMIEGFRNYPSFDDRGSAKKAAELRTVILKTLRAANKKTHTEQIDAIRQEDVIRKEQGKPPRLFPANFNQLPQAERDRLRQEMMNSLGREAGTINQMSQSRGKSMGERHRIEQNNRRLLESRASETF